MATSFFALVLGLAATGAAGTKQYPGLAPVAQQPYQQMSQQPFLIEPLQAPSLGQYLAPMGLQPQQPQFAQSLLQSPMLQPQQPLSSEDESADDATPMAMNQLQHGTASLSMQDVIALEGSFKDLQKKKKSLQKQLSEAHAREKQLNDMTYAAQYRSSTVDQSAQKLAQLAQTSVLQAQQSMSQEKSVVQAMKKKLQETEHARSRMQQEIAQTQVTINSLRSAVASSQARERAAVQAQHVAEHDAWEAEQREVSTLKAGEMEDKALSRQEEVMNEIRVGTDDADSVDVDRTRPASSAPHVKSQRLRGRKRHHAAP